jgi:Protein of unknown function (DUF3047)
MARESPASPDVIIFDPVKDGLGKDDVPVGWKLKQWFGGGHDIRIEENDGRSVLHLISKENSFGVYKKKQFDIRDLPLLSWRWKVTVLPTGGDVRSKHTDDQAAQVYVLFPKFPAAVNTRLVGYIWENLTPKNLHVTSQKSSNTRYVVLRNHTDPLNQWMDETRDVLQDYRDLFHEEPPEVEGITLMIDSDDTKSSAESYFDILQFRKK